MVATSKMVDKMAEICLNSSEDLRIFYIVLKLYLFTLNTFVRILKNDQAETVRNYVINAQSCIIKLIQKPTFGYEESFGGKNGDKSKNEIEVRM